MARVNVGKWILTHQANTSPSLNKHSLAELEGRTSLLLVITGILPNQSSSLLKIKVMVLSVGILLKRLDRQILLVGIRFIFLEVSVCMLFYLLLNI